MKTKSTRGAIWFARYADQAAAAAKRRNRKRELTRPGKGSRTNWKKEI
jgi:hypothetical protein